MGQLTHQHDKDVETAFLGTCLFDPRNMDEPFARMPDEAFYYETHRTVWRAMRAEHAEDHWFDSVTLMERARREGTTNDMLTWMDRAFGMWSSEVPPHSWLSDIYARKMKVLYANRERAKAARQYEKDIADGIDPNDARLTFELVCNALDEITEYDKTSTDEQIADQMGEGGRYPTGYADLDKRTGGYANPGFIVIAARPAVGKSSFARGTIRHAAKNGDRVLWYSQDQSANQIMELEIARLLRTTGTGISKLTRDQRIDAIQRVRHEVWHDRVELIDRPLPLTQLLSMARISRPDLIVVDYVQIIDAGHHEEYDNITATSKALKTLAFQLRCPVLGLAQFSRAQKTGVTPNMANLKGSGQLEQDAEQILALDRDMDVGGEGQATLYIVKNKVGPTGTVNLTWLPKWATYENVSWRAE